MKLTAAQVKGRIKSLSSKEGTDARILLRIFMMEHFLERLSKSEYSDKFIIKGGILVTSLLGIQHRYTMDIDASVSGFKLNSQEIEKIVHQVASIDIDDDITFRIESIADIMDEMEYPGIRVSLTGIQDQIKCPLKLDVSTGDIITPHAVRYEYKLLLENRTIQVMSYNLETVLSEKLQTVLSRSVFNTRMRDLYDLKMLSDTYSSAIDDSVLKQAYRATLVQRNTINLNRNRNQIIHEIENDTSMKNKWSVYQTKYSYAENISYNDVISSIKSLLKRCQ